jgi:hypothetical protein
MIQPIALNSWRGTMAHEHSAAIACMQLAATAAVVTAIMLVFQPERASLGASAAIDARDQSDGWSPTAQGVRARLVATDIPAPAEDGVKPADPPRRQLRLDFEIQNVSDVNNPIAIWWTGWDMLDLSLVDDKGATLPKEGMAGSEWIPFPYWLQLPHGSSMRTLISDHAYEYINKASANPNRVFLRLSLLQAWPLGADRPSSSLFLNGVFASKVSPEPRDRPWRGTLVLPRVLLPGRAASAPATAVAR